MGPVSERAIHFGVLIGAIALSAWTFTGPVPNSANGTVRAERAPSAAASPLAIIPPGSAFVLSANLAALARAPVGAVFAERLGRLGRASELTKRCGFDLLTRLEQLALAVPSAGLPGTSETHPDDFGIVASGQFSGAEITRCASAVIAQRGGEAAFARLGSFSSVRDRKGSGGEVAAKNGLLVVSGGSYFRELLDSAEGTGVRAPHDPRDARHAELRRALGPGEISATWLLADGWFQRVSGDQEARLSPLGALIALGARVQVGANAHLTVLLDCADATGAAKVQAWFNELRSSLGAFGLEPALAALAQRVELTPSGSRLRLDLTLTAHELSALLNALFSDEMGPAKR